jgi:hypothetical protein|tara:strand:- start:123 stop:437 length:315 start_codon:yes stop_codon:yes gene_type:complete
MDAGYCYFHNPDVPDEVRKENARKGGLVKKYEPLVKRDFYDNLVEDSKSVLIETVNQLREGSMPPNVANSIVYACSTLQKVYEVQDLEKRLNDLEHSVLETKIV